jgi:hypothetical protein
MADISWLPQPITLDSFGGDWGKYTDELYRLFRRDFVTDKAILHGQRVGLKRYPQIRGREASFWHLISEGEVESDRLPDLRRCERIRWPRCIIDSADRDEVLSWTNTRGCEIRRLLWVPDADYLTVLAVRKGYFVLWTAYNTEREHTRRKLWKEYKSNNESEKNG